MKIKRGDKVIVIAGSDKGSIGEVIKIDTKKERVAVEGVKILTKHIKPSQNNPEGRISEEEGFIHVSNVALYDSIGKKPVKVGYRFEDGEKVRYMKGSNALVDKKKKKRK